tara:strand:+ start:2502 stop:3113 length:612 start_codon:yes stop_codon:yes gene_type:complete
MRTEQHIPFATPIFTVDCPNLKTHQELKDTALTLEKTGERREISNSGGYQSNAFTIKDPLVYKFWFEILPTIQNMLSLYNIGYNYDTNIDNLWFNVNRKHNYNHIHMHPGSEFSGVYYLEAPTDCGNLTFYNPNKALNNVVFYNRNFGTYNEFNSLQYHVKPKKNLLVLFPAFLEHSVDMNLSDEPRISLAFNIQVKPEGQNE